MRVYVAFTLLIVILAGCSSGPGIERECFSISRFRRASTPYIDVYLMNVRGNGKSRIDVYSQMPFRNLRFEKIKDGFRAAYTLQYILRDSTNTVIQTKDADRSVEARTYEETISRRTDIVLQQFTVDPGRYILEIESLDKLSQFRSRRVIEARAEDLSAGRFRISDPLFLSAADPSAQIITLKPILPVTISSLTDTVGIFQEIYSLQKGDSIRIIQHYRTAKDDGRGLLVHPRMLPPYRTFGPPCADLSDSISYRSESVHTAERSGTFQSVLKYPLPPAGYSIVERLIHITRNGITDTQRTETRLFRREKKFLSGVSLDEESAALRFLLQENEFDSLTTGTSADRNRWINDFWSERGGTIKRKEFLARVAEANTLFTECGDGSRTPMGIVYIICGSPDQVECTGGYTETWYYHIGDRSYAVPFRRLDDKSTIFELEPFSVSDVLWQYSLDHWRRKR